MIKIKYRVRWNPKYKTFVIERKDWFSKWEIVDSADTQERAIAMAKEFENPTIVWEN